MVKSLYLVVTLLYSVINSLYSVLIPLYSVLMSIYYMEESVLLGTKPLVDSIRHFIRDPSGVFSVCHLCECRIVQRRHDSLFYVLVARIISHSFAALTREIIASLSTRVFETRTATGREHFAR